MSHRVTRGALSSRRHRSYFAQLRRKPLRLSLLINTSHQNEVTSSFYCFLRTHIKMQHIAASAASGLSTESLAEWAGQSSPVKTTPFPQDHGKTLEHAEADRKQTSSIPGLTHPSLKVHEDAPKVPNQLPKSGRSPSPRPASPVSSPSPTAARLASLNLAQPKKQTEETARPTTARRAPSCEWKHEDFKHNLHLSWLHHHPKPKNQ